ncbi:iron ABC transporter permease [Candidatus Thioglobus sp.]|jgi:iron(III) transport system permease protein|nr:iron ABC transporter permease [Candidatus Thioglobus sp.]MDC1386095.1 iron ABC transporter permease [Candidatus Thioglobus sp.]MDC3360040.1 iron ABC transporter permease [Candidatus Thioglobus sp.]|tara:strand:+ start:983 stop:2806 length:1824 start_codon:yes stop_codon:yes gene_type:complete
MSNFTTQKKWFDGAIRGLLLNPVNIALALLLVVLAYLVLWPFFQLVLETLTWGEGDRRLSRDAVPGEFTWFHWLQATASPIAGKMLYGPLINTLITGIIATIIALSAGGILAWCVVRSDMPGKGWLQPILTLPYIIPSFAIALAWETVFRSPKVGGQPGLYESFLGVAPPEWISYGTVPISITLAIHYFPFAYLLVAGALATIDSQMEESALISGAGKLTILRRITFPVVAPAFVAAFILTFGKTIGQFALPFLLGAPVQFHTVATMVYANLALGLDSLAFVLAVILIVISLVSIWLSNRFVGKKSSRFETIGGKGFRSREVALGQWRWPVFLTVALFAFIVGILPLILLAVQSVMLIDGFFGLENLTWHFWTGGSNPDIAFGEPGVFHNNNIIGATWNTLKLASISAVIASVIGLIIAYIVVRKADNPLAQALDQIAFIPFLFPTIAFGAMYLTLFAEPVGPIPALYGTFSLLVLISVVSRLPYSVKTGVTAVTQIGKELEEAAEVAGASWSQRFRRIVMPLASAGLTSGMMVSFVGVMRELSLIILLITPSTRVLMTAGFGYAEEGLTQLSNALVLIVAILTILGELILWWIGKGRMARLREKLD